MRPALVFDLDGVVYLGDEAVPGSREVLTDLDRAGHQLLFCTNNSSRTRRQTAEKIARVVGYSADPESIITSAMAAGLVLNDHRHPVYVLGGNGIDEMLEDKGIDRTYDYRSASAVVAGIDHEISYRRLADAALAIRRGARFIGTNGDKTYPTPEGQLPGAGSILAAVEAASGVTAEIAGKPHEPMQRLITSMVGDAPIWMVGDRPETDLAMAEDAGWISVLVLTGVIDDPATSPITPTYVADSIADVPRLLM